jgi:chromosome segregation protein
MLQEQFQETLTAVNVAFGRQFQRLFGGGRAQLSLGEGEEGAGIELILQPPGKRTQSVTALSGGERALAAAALLLALLSVHHTPFVVLDEVDAALDQANIARFLEALQEMAQHTQVLLITHQPASMEVAERLYGIVQQEHGVVQAFSLQLDSAHQPAPRNALPLLN